MKVFNPESIIDQLAAARCDTQRKRGPCRLVAIMGTEAHDALKSEASMMAVFGIIPSDSPAQVFGMAIVRSPYVSGVVCMPVEEVSRIAYELSVAKWGGLE